MRNASACYAPWMLRLWSLMLLLAGCSGSHGTDGDLCVGVCECRVDADCTGAHTVCFDQVTSRTCTCAAGYTMGVSGCAWTGVVDDPGFDHSPDAWLVGGPATLQPTAAQILGMVDVGLAELDITDPRCSQSGQVSQTIMMPRRSRAEPLVVLASSAATNDQFDWTAAVGIGVGWFGQPFGTNRVEFQTVRVCLGAANYAPESSTGPGIQVPFVVFPPVQPTTGISCSPSDSVSIDHIEIAPATPTDACPDPGQVPNGDAEGTGGWTLSAYPPAQAAIMPGIGANGTNGVQLSAPCGTQAEATVPVSIPVADATGSPALTFFHSGATSADAGVALEQLSLALSGDGLPTIDRYCIPAPLRGSVVTFDVLLGGGNACTGVVNQAVIDDVAVANDPACGIDPYVADPGFESGLGSVPGTSAAPVVADPAAHGGTRDLQLTAMGPCAGASYQALVATPPVSPGEGAAVSFYYKSSGGYQLLFSTYSDTSTMPTTSLTFDGQWHQAFVCIDPRHPGRTQTLTFSLVVEPTSEGCIDGGGTAVLDDLAAVSTPMCPAI